MFYTWDLKYHMFVLQGSRSRSQSRPYIHLEVSPSDALEMQADEFLEATGSHSGDVYDEGYPDEGTASYDPFADVFMQSEDYPGGGPSPAEIDEALARSRKCFNLLIKDGRSLKEALQTYDKGKLILQVYQQQGYLDKANAILLCDLIMQHEFQGDPHTRLGGHAFLALAKSIIELFPNERIESYYVPYRYIDGQRKERARGRLLDKYEHRLKAFRAAGLIKSRNRRILSKSKSHQDKS